MKILVFAHRLDIGGTQVNSIELSACLQDRFGHDVSIFATPGPMAELIRQKGLRYFPAPHPSAHPSPARMRALRQVIMSERPDVMHVWDWPQCLDAYFGAFLWTRMPMVVTSMAMVVNRLLPKSVPTTFGTPELVARATASGRPRLTLMMPPVDVHLNSPAAVDGKVFRLQHGFADTDIVLVTVSRLVEWMKAESLRDTIDVVRRLGRDFPLRFVIVGDGSSLPEIERLAAAANAELGRTAIVLTGAMIDPRPAYAGADIVVGMGGSALRGMAFAKAVVVVGEKGFSAPFNPETAEFFYNKGLYGLGDGCAGSKRLAQIIRTLATSPDRLSDLGQFGREFVLNCYSIEIVSTELERILTDAAQQQRPRLSNVIADGVRTASLLMAQKLVPSKIRRILGR